jgi:hypothetical protein
MGYFIGHHFESQRAVEYLAVRLGRHDTPLTTVESRRGECTHTVLGGDSSQPRKNDAPPRSLLPMPHSTGRTQIAPPRTWSSFPLPAIRSHRSPVIAQTSKSPEHRDCNATIPTVGNQGLNKGPTPCQRNLVHDAKPSALACPLRFRKVAWIVSP